MIDGAEELAALIGSYRGLVVCETVEERRVGALLENVASTSGLRMFDWTVTDGLRRLPDETPLAANTHDPSTALGHLIDLSVESVFWLKDFAVHLDHPTVRRRMRDAVEAFSGTRSCIVVTGAAVELPGEVASQAARFTLQPPGEAELGRLLDETLDSLRLRHVVGVALDATQREAVVRAMAGMTLNQARQAIAQAALEDGVLDGTDVARIAASRAGAVRDGGLLEYYPPGGDAAALGGFGGVKAWLARAALGFSERAAAMNLSPPRGILLVGVQGCGKSLAARAVSGMWGIPLLKLEAGALFDKFVGETERNFRRATEVAASVAPCVLWIDEIEKGFGGSGSGEHDGGVGRRLLGGFLTWLQEKTAEIFVVGTANDLGVLPPELLRKGRFDEIFFVDLPTAAERGTIFEIHLRRRNADPSGFDGAALVAASAGFSGAEIEQAIIAASYEALHHSCPLDTGLVAAELARTVPLSVTRREDIEALRRHATGRFVPAA